jgi:hypothetical protein
MSDIAPFFGGSRAMTLLTPFEYATSGTEHAEQVALFMWAWQVRDEHPELQSMFAIPNGGLRSKATAGRLKAEGVKAGVSDVFLPLPMWYRKKQGGVDVVDVYHGLYIEMKRKRAQNVRNTDPDFGATTEERAFIKLMKSRSYAATVCHGWEEARDVLLSYLKLRTV